MYTGFIVKAGETTGEYIIDKSIKDFNYNDIDVICIKNTDNNNIIDSIENINMVKQILEITEDIDIEILLTKYLNFLNQNNTVTDK